jgi:hypothetical protein
MPPFLLALLGQGLGILGNAVIAKGKDVIEEKLGINIEESLQTAEGKQKLLQLQIDHEEFLVNSVLENRKLDLLEFQAQVADVSNARDTNAKIQESPNASWMAKNAIYIIAFVVIFGGGWMVYTSQEADVRMAVVSCITLVLGWFFGSSKNNGSKDETIAKLAQGAQHDAR